jgi:tripartite-type tricarboxylate transporter receptor subunit TctC
MKPSWRLSAPIAFLVVGLAASNALSQSYPTKPVRLVVPFPAGGAVDTVARTLGQKLGESLRQQVVIENRAGAGGNIGTDAVAKSAPDGYTILMTTHGHAISPNLYRKLSYDSIKDFTPVTQLTSSFLLLVANPSLPATSLKELIAVAKAKPGSLNYGSTGLGAPPHLVTELVKLMAGIDMAHIPYKGDAPLFTALLGGEVQLAFVPPVTGLPHVRAGRLRALAVTSGKRSPTLPDVPTVAEAGVPGFEYSGWLAILAPAGTPREVVGKLQGDIAKVVGTPEMRDRFLGWGYEPVAGTPEEFAGRLRADIARYARVIKDAKIPLVD